MAMKEFREILMDIDRSYEGFVDTIANYIMMTGNYDKMAVVADYINDNPGVDSSEVLHYMVDELGILSRTA